MSEAKQCSQCMCSRQNNLYGPKSQYPQGSKQPYYEEKQSKYQEEKKSPCYYEEKKPYYDEPKKPCYEDKKPPYYEDKKPPCYEEKKPSCYEDKKSSCHEDKKPPCYEDKKPSCHEEKKPPCYKPEPKPPCYGSESKPPSKDKYPYPIYDEDRKYQGTTSIKACESINYHKARVSIPVEIKPFSEIGPVCAKCNGRPQIIPGDIECYKHSDKCCKFIISQEVTVAIPVEFGAKTIVGDEYIECMTITNDKDKL